MASVIIGSARHDEHGSCYHGGSAGDQLQTSTPDYSGEVSLQDFYVHSKGWYISRLKSVEYADKIAELMYDACNNAHIGYDQDQRNGIITYGIHTTTNTECDCSSLVRECFKEATGKDPGDFTTAGEVDALYATGLVESRITYKSGVTLYTGDILTTQTKGHTVIVVKGTPRTSDSTGTTSGTGSGTTGSGTSTKLDVDGEIGPKTVKRLQQFCGLTQTGTIGSQPSSGKQYWTSILSSVVTWSSGKSDTVRAFQKYLYDKGYKSGVNFKDGKLGKNTAKCAQQFLKDKGYYTGSIDSIFGTQSAKALQTWLNK